MQSVVRNFLANKGQRLLCLGGLITGGTLLAQALDKPIGNDSSWWSSIQSFVSQWGAGQRQQCATLQM